jgi:hypothetical protein
MQVSQKIDKIAEFQTWNVPAMDLVLCQKTIETFSGRYYTGFRI